MSKSQLEQATYHRNRYYLQTMGIPIWIQGECPEFLFTPTQQHTTAVESDCLPELKSELDLSVSPTNEQNSTVFPEKPLSTQVSGVENHNIASEPEQKNLITPATEQIKQEVQKTSDNLNTETVLRASSSPQKQDYPLKLQQLYQQISSCEHCQWHHCHTADIYSGFLQQASESVSLMIVQLQPHELDYRQRHFLAGEALLLLKNMLKSVDLLADNIYFTSLLKGYARVFRFPNKEELANCRQYWLEEFDILRPKVILTLGEMDFSVYSDKLSIQGIENNDNSLLNVNQMRQAQLSLADTPIISTYSPGFLLRNPEFKAQAYEDLIKLRSLLQNAE